MAAGFDHNIILQGMRQVPNALEVMRELQGMQQQRQAHEMTLAGLLQKQQQAKTLADLYRQNAGNMDDLPQALMQAGFGNEAFQAQDQQSQLAARSAQAQRAMMDGMREKFGLLARPLHGLKDQAGLDNAYAFWRQSGASEQDLAWLPKEYNEQTAPFFKQLAEMAIPPEKRAQMEADTQRFEETKRHNRASEETARRNADSYGRRAESAKQKAADDKRAKQEAADAELYVEGAEFLSGGRPTKQNRDAFAKIKTSAELVDKSLSNLSAAMDSANPNAPGTEAFGDKSVELEGERQAVLMQLKNLYELGVLNGPDLALMERQVPAITGAKGMFTRNSAAKTAFDTLRRQISDRLQASAKNNNYRLKGAAGAAPPRAGMVRIRDTKTGKTGWAEPDAVPEGAEVVNGG